MKNKNFYPTPESLICKMISKIEGYPRAVLEPSAGKGDIIKAVKSRFNHNHKVSAIEIDQMLQATLRGNGYNLLDSDFLEYSGPDKFDLIIANPPFDNGDKHLLKAIDIMYRGQIIFLLNAETLKNQCTNTRKLLSRKLTELNAEIEFIDGAFNDAERPTGVQVALINIIIKKDIAEDLFDGCTDKAAPINADIEGPKELSKGKDIEEMVLDYNLTVAKCTQVIMDYFKNYPRCGKYLSLTPKNDSYSDDLTGKVQTLVNDTVQTIRRDYWRKVLSLDAVHKRLTTAKSAEFTSQLDKQSFMDFTSSNIRQFVINLIGGYEQTLVDAVMALFDRFTGYSWHEGPTEKNIHYFDGWKTNSAFKIRSKVIIPVRSSYGPTFNDDWNGEWKLNYSAADVLDDIDKVMNYFDGLSHYQPISTALTGAFAVGESRKIVSTYFTLTAYKKGTLHLTFNDDDILRRFNVVACRGKGWLPGDYGAKGYAELTHDEKQTVNSFEGQASYTEKRQTALFATNMTAITN